MKAHQPVNVRKPNQPARRAAPQVIHLRKIGRILRAAFLPRKRE